MQSKASILKIIMHKNAIRCVLAKNTFMQCQHKMANFVH